MSPFLKRVLALLQPHRRWALKFAVAAASLLVARLVAQFYVFNPGYHEPQQRKFVVYLENWLGQDRENVTLAFLHAGKPVAGKTASTHIDSIGEPGTRSAYDTLARKELIIIKPLALNPPNHETQLRAHPKQSGLRGALLQLAEKKYIRHSAAKTFAPEVFSLRVHAQVEDNPPAECEFNLREYSSVEVGLFYAALCALALAFVSFVNWQPLAKRFLRRLGNKNLLHLLQGLMYLARQILKHIEMEPTGVGALLKPFTGMADDFLEHLNRQVQMLAPDHPARAEAQNLLRAMRSLDQEQEVKVTAGFLNTIISSCEKLIHERRLWAISLSDNLDEVVNKWLNSREWGEKYEAFVLLLKTGLAKILQAEKAKREKAWREFETVVQKIPRELAQQLTEFMKEPALRRDLAVLEAKDHAQIPRAEVSPEAKFEGFFTSSAQAQGDTFHLEALVFERKVVLQKQEVTLALKFSRLAEGLKLEFAPGGAATSNNLTLPAVLPKGESAPVTLPLRLQPRTFSLGDNLLIAENEVVLKKDVTQLRRLFGLDAV